MALSLSLWDCAAKKFEIDKRTPTLLKDEDRTAQAAQTCLQSLLWLPIHNAICCYAAQLRCNPQQPMASSVKMWKYRPENGSCWDTPRMIFVTQARSMIDKCQPESVERFAEDFDLTFNKKDGTERDLPALPTGLIRLKGINSQICYTRQRKPASEWQS